MAVSTQRFAMNANMHAAFQRELARLSEAVSRIDLHDPVAVAGLQRRFRFFETTLRTHHEGEDKYLWPTAIAQADPQETIVLAAMESEHEQMGQCLDLVSGDFASLGPDSDVADITTHIKDLGQVLHGHCLHEERDGVPIVAKYIEDEDLKRLMKDARSAPDADLVLAWVCDGAPTEVADATWGMLPRPVRLFVRPMTMKKYRSFTEECGV